MYRGGNYLRKKQLDFSIFGYLTKTKKHVQRSCFLATDVCCGLYGLR